MEIIEWDEEEFCKSLGPAKDEVHGKQESATEFDRRYQKALDATKEPKLLIKPKRLKEIVACLNKIINKYTLQITDSV